MPDEATLIDAATMRLYVINSLLDAVRAHEWEADQLPPWGRAAKRHEAAAATCYELHDKVEAFPEDDPAFVEMAFIWQRTGGRCRKKDSEFFWRLDYTARGYEAALDLLEAMLINWRRVDWQEKAARQQR